MVDGNKQLGKEEALAEAVSVHDVARMLAKLEGSGESPSREHLAAADRLHNEMLENLGPEKYAEGLTVANVRAEIANLLGPEVFNKFNSGVTNKLEEFALQIAKIISNNKTEEAVLIVLNDPIIQDILSKFEGQKRKLLEGLLKADVEIFISAMKEEMMKSFTTLIEVRRMTRE